MMHTTEASDQEMCCKRGVCVVNVRGNPDAKPLKVKVWVQKLGRWWRCLPRPAYKKVAVFDFHWEEVWHRRMEYTSMPADIDVGRLQKASARSEDALVKMEVTYSYGKITHTTPVEEFVGRLREEEPRGLVLQVAIATEDYDWQGEQQQQARSEGVEGHGGEPHTEGTEGQGEADQQQPKWVGKISQDCSYPWWRIMKNRQLKPLPTKPPTKVETYVEIMTQECKVLRSEAKVALKGGRSCKSELAALMAEMDRMEQELDRAEASWASFVLGGEGEGEVSEHLEEAQEEQFTLTDDELWRELFGDEGSVSVSNSKDE